VEEGYKLLREECAFPVLLSDTVVEFLAHHVANERQHVKKMYVNLERLADFGLQGIKNTEFFKSEGKYPDGRAGGKDLTVYALKARRLRIYGGLIQKDGRSHFFFVHAVVKKSNKADRTILEKTAKVLGELHD